MSSSVTGGGADPTRSTPCGCDRAVAEAAEEEGIDHFDRLPDSVLLVVLNRIGDVKALGRICVVSRRFQALVPQVHSVLVRVDCVISDDGDDTTSATTTVADSIPDRPRGVFSHLARLVLKPIQALTQILIPSTVSTIRAVSHPSSHVSPSVSSSEISHHSPTEVLTSFKDLRHLKIELPNAELGVEDGVLLKWKADFGSTLDRCVILGASSKSSNPNPNSQENPDGLCDPLDSGSIPESFYTNGSLKLRVVWTISSLIAASARHYLLLPIIAAHNTLERLDLSDADGQGVLSMDRGQLQEVQMKPVLASGSSHRTLVPALNMRLWYAPELELPGGLVLKGATLVAIQPSEKEAVGGSGVCWVSNAFEEPYRTAARLLVKRRTYCLEMNSF